MRRVRVLTLVGVMALAPVAPAAAQPFGPPAEGATPVMPGPAAGNPSMLTDAPGAGGFMEGTDFGNPLAVLGGAAAALPGAGAKTDEAGKPGGGLSTALNVVLVLTVLSLVPSILLMCTCFLRIVIVLGLLKQALGTQSMPPGQVMLGLSLIMTLLVMSPTIKRINDEAIEPWRSGEVRDYTALWNKAKQPVRDFMFAQIETTGNWSSVYMILNFRGIDTSRPELLSRESVDMLSLVPAFVLSELKVSFLMGFRIYLPFLVIDMVISSILISMSMMMLPPVLISLPFKLLLFVLVDGWALITGSLMGSFAQPMVGAVLTAAGGG